MSRVFQDERKSVSDLESNLHGEKPDQASVQGSIHSQLSLDMCGVYAASHGHVKAG